MQGHFAGACVKLELRSSYLSTQVMLTSAKDYLLPRLVVPGPGRAEREINSGVLYVYLHNATEEQQTQYSFTGNQSWKLASVISAMPVGMV
jgi:hypothetical protein